MIFFNSSSSGPAPAILISRLISICHRRAANLQSPFPRSSGRNKKYTYPHLMPIANRACPELACGELVESAEGGLRRNRDRQ